MIDGLINNPYIQYIISPTIIAGVVAFILIKVMNFGELREQFKNMQQDIKDIKKDFNLMEKQSAKTTRSLDKIKTYLIADNGLDSSIFAINSPLSLTEKGEKLLDETEFRQIYKENKDWFLDEIRKYNVKTMADIDEAAVKVLEKCRENEKFIDYKEIAFENGIFVEVLLRALAIYLREEAGKEILD